MERGCIVLKIGESFGGGSWSFPAAGVRLSGVQLLGAMERGRPSILCVVKGECRGGSTGCTGRWGMEGGGEVQSGGDGEGALAGRRQKRIALKCENG